MTDTLRRDLIKYSALSMLTLPAYGCLATTDKDSLFKISLAQWSLHRTLFGANSSAERLRGLPPGKVRETLRDNPDFLLRGDLDPLDFPRYARSEFDIDAVEYVNTFYLGKARDDTYLAELKRRADGEGVKNVLIMCDLEGDLGHPDAEQRQWAIENHYKWIDAAAALGCHAIRVNAKSSGSPSEQKKLAADGLNRLAQYSEKKYSAKKYGGKNPIHVLVENHGGLSSDPNWLSSAIVAADHSLVGTLPDFGNFHISGTEQFDYYKGVELLMPHAKAVSAKSIDFNEEGEHTTFDYLRLMRTVVAAGYGSYVGIEYEGEHLPEETGIRLTKALLETVHEQLVNEMQKTT